MRLWLRLRALWALSDVLVEQKPHLFLDSIKSVFNSNAAVIVEPNPLEQVPL